MKIKYYTRYFSFILTISITCFFFGACSKLVDRYLPDNELYGNHEVNMQMAQGHSSSSEMGITPKQSEWSQALFEAIKEGNKDQVTLLIGSCSKDICINEKLYELDSNGNTCLHIAAGCKKESSKEIIAYLIAYLIDNIKLLISCRSGEQHPLLFRNAGQETPLLIAMKQGNQDVLDYLLVTTHQHVGLDLAVHTDREKNNLFSIALNKAVREQSISALKSLLDQVFWCSRGLWHQASSKCKAEGITLKITQVIRPNRYPHPYPPLSKAVYDCNSDLLTLLLETIKQNEGPIACLEALVKRYPLFQRLTILHTALDRGGELGGEHKAILNVLFKYLRGCGDDLMKASSTERARARDELQIQLYGLAMEVDSRRDRGFVSLSKEHGFQDLLEELYRIIRVVIAQIQTPPGQNWSGDLPDLQHN